jgi:hypothetical protein
VNDLVRGNSARLAADGRGVDTGAVWSDYYKGLQDSYFFPNETKSLRAQVERQTPQPIGESLFF